ncbi:MAG: hypothetical protein ACFFE5_06145 [Candidatus Thorarchaeota archaeon]
MVTTSRPTCRKCGAKILKSRGNFKWSSWNVPEHCWKCGEKISSEQLQHLKNFESFQCCLSLIVIVILLVTIIPIAIFTR